MKDFKLKYYSIKFLIFALLLLGAESCNGPAVVDNPPPFLQITEGPAEDAVIAVNYATFGWSGSDNGFEYRYRMLALDEDNFPTVYRDWSEWGTVTEITFSNLDESKYRFEVSGRLKDHTDQELTVSRVFTVDAFRGPALMFFKTETEMTVGQSDSISVWVEGVDSLVALHAVIAFDTTYLSLQGISKGSFVERSGFEQITVPDFSDAGILSQVNSTGKIDINSAVLATLYTLPRRSLTGSGSFITMKFKAKAVGSTRLSYTMVEFHTEDGRVFSGNPPKDGTVIITGK